jgi:pSer/pThr/pTyr-binding forkhead associated (FHA) protein
MSTIFVLEGTGSLAGPPMFPLRDMITVVGRSSECDLVLHSTKVSRRHAEVVIGRSVISVTDLGSRNGTFLDEQRIHKMTVAHGQLVRFGDVSFVFSERVLHADGIGEEGTEDCYSQEKADIIRAKASLLTEAQRRVLELLVDGISNKQIALELDVSQHTIHTHVQAIFKTLQVHSRCELLACLVPPNGRPIAIRR